MFQISVDVIEAAQALQQTQRRFLSDTRHTRNVVHLVSHERQEIDNQRGRDTEFSFYAGLIHHRVGHRVDQRSVRIHQLRHIFVAGGNHHMRPLFARLAR